MDDQLTAEELAKLRALYDAATPGEWREHFGYMNANCMAVAVGDSFQNRIIIADFENPNLDPERRKKFDDRHEENGAFVAAVHNALPKLLDRIEALEAELALLRAGG